MVSLARALTVMRLCVLVCVCVCERVVCVNARWSDANVFNVVLGQRRVDRKGGRKKKRTKRRTTSRRPPRTTHIIIIIITIGIVIAAAAIVIILYLYGHVVRAQHDIRTGSHRRVAPCY